MNDIPIPKNVIVDDTKYKKKRFYLIMVVTTTFIELLILFAGIIAIANSYTGHAIFCFGLAVANVFLVKHCNNMYNRIK